MSIVVDEEEAVVVEVVAKEDEGKEFSLPTIRRPADRRAMCRQATYLYVLLESTFCTHLYVTYMLFELLHGE